MSDEVGVGQVPTGNAACELANADDGVHLAVALVEPEGGFVDVTGRLGETWCYVPWIEYLSTDHTDSMLLVWISPRTYSPRPWFTVSCVKVSGSAAYAAAASV